MSSVELKQGESTHHGDLQSHDRLSAPERRADLEALLTTPMVSWYSPFKLAKTACDIVVSSLLGERADFRLIEALGEPQGHFDYSVDAGGAPRDALWLDYVADVADGFNPTFAIASLLSRPRLTVDGHATTRGEVLVMGGDQVYPSASRAAYQLRLVRPYALASRSAEARKVIGDVFAIPGNHDWYDGLTAFMRLFGQKRTVAAWRTRQSRSYFALKLPHGFWLLGVDIQLYADIDQPQMEYFCQIATREMKAGDRVVLCTAEPDWVVGKIYDAQVQDNLAFFEERILKARPGIRVAARIAGDLHHYRRHASDRGEQNIIAGGGGAFLHPTHGEPVDEVRSGPRGAEAVYRLQKSFPSIERSRRLAWNNLAFSYFNHDFHAVAIVAYAVLSLVVLRPGIASLVGVVVFLALFVLFTDTSRLGYRLTGGTLHALAHASVALGVTALAARHMGLDRYPLVVEGSCGGARCWRVQDAPIWRELAVLAFTGAVGGVFGPLVLGAYLILSLNVFRRHGNEAFSSLRIPDYKNFLRLHVERDRLTIYPIGLEKVPRKWAVQGDLERGAARVVPVDAPLAPTLIEPPIVLSKAGQDDA